MNARPKITVSNPRWGLHMCLFVIMLMIIFNVLFTVFSKPPHLAMYITTFLSFVLPCSVAAMWFGLYKVTVDGSKITVRRATGLKYCFDISEVKRVTWRKNAIRMTAFDEPSGTTIVGLQVIRVYTMSGKRISIETMMNGFDQMSEYIEENVDQSKIHFINRSFGK